MPKRPQVLQFFDDFVAEKIFSRPFFDTVSYQLNLFRILPKIFNENSINVDYKGVKDFKEFFKDNFGRFRDFKKFWLSALYLPIFKF